jgi:hypothetical protein
MTANFVEKRRRGKASSETVGNARRGIEDDILDASP